MLFDSVLCGVGTVFLRNTGFFRKSLELKGQRLYRNASGSNNKSQTQNEPLTPSIGTLKKLHYMGGGKRFDICIVKIERKMDRILANKTAKHYFAHSLTHNEQDMIAHLCRWGWLSPIAVTINIITKTVHEIVSSPSAKAWLIF